jgi:hypothetical protein
MSVRLIRGEVSYREPDAGVFREFGREYFSVSVFPNGSRTLRALCCYHRKGITRDVIYSVGADWKPREAFVRVALESEIVGSAWFRFTEEFAEAEGFTRGEGRYRQRIDVPTRIFAFGSHPICSDIWRLAHLSTERGDQLQILENCMNSSPAASGDTGPMLFPRRYHYRLGATETIETIAGEVRCHRFDWAVREGKTLRMWTTAPDFLPYCMDCPETGQRYDLVVLDDSAEG